MSPCKCKMRMALASPKPCQSVWPPHVCWARKSWMRWLGLPLTTSSSGTLSETRVCFLLNSCDLVTDSAVRWLCGFLGASIFLWNCIYWALNPHKWRFLPAPMHVSLDKANCKHSMCCRRAHDACPGLSLTLAVATQTEPEHPTALTYSVTNAHCNNCSLKGCLLEACCTGAEATLWSITF